MDIRSLSPDAIDHISLTIDGEAIEFRKRDAEWSIVAPLTARSDANALRTLLDKVTSLRPQETITAEPMMHERFGVGDGGIVVRLGEGPCSLEFVVGAFLEGATALRILPGDEVVSVDGSIRYAFNKPLRDWRDRHITDLEVADIRALTFGTLRVERDGSAWSGDARAVFDWVEPAARTIARLRAVDFAPPGTSAAEAGFDTGWTVRVEASTTFDLELGGSVDGGFYLRRSGDDTIYIVSAYVAEHLHPSQADSP